MGVTPDAVPKGNAVRCIIGTTAAWYMSAGPRVASMHEAELWSRLEAALGRGYVGSWASTVALQEPESRIVDEALAAGVLREKIWRAAWVMLKPPETMR